MEETIELRGLLETVWKGKWIIATITAMFVLVAAILSWFVLPEQYESKATVQVVGEVQDTGIMSSYIMAEFTPVIFSQRIKDEMIINGMFKEKGINEKINKDDISATVQGNTNLIDLKYTTSSAEKSKEHLTLFIDITKDQMNASIKNTLMELEKTYNSEVNLLSVEIESLIEQYNKLIVSNGLPEMLIMQTLVNSEIIMSISDEQSQALARVNGILHNELIQMQAQVTSKSAEYALVLDKYQAVKTGLDSFRPDPFIRTIVEPTIPEKPSAPSKLMNVAIAMIIGLMTGLGIVFFRHYWKNSAPTK